MKLYRTEASEPKLNAQRNLMGRTHYVDDDTLRFHRSRVLSTKVVDGGLLFAIVTSDGLDWHNTRRGFRYVVFDVFGTVLSRLSLEEAFSSRAKATAALWAYLETVDAVSHTLEAIERAERLFAEEMKELRVVVRNLSVTEAAE